MAKPTTDTQNPNRQAPLSYRSAGVNIDAGNALVDIIKPLAKATARAGAGASLGGFGAFIELAPILKNYAEPCLIASTDGVGTKVKIAAEAGQYAGIGIDLVAMCANDILVHGADPLFFLDYYATSKLQIDAAAAVIESIAAGCIEAGCALVGGETAEMPGVYADKDFDLAGFVVGIVDKSKALTGKDVAEGDVLIGIPSSGIHANGFSLVRRVIQDLGLSFTDSAPYAPGKSLADVLLTPTRIYRKVMQTALHAGGVTGAVHITGGGLIENLPRMFGDTLAARIDANSWPALPVFQWLQTAGQIPDYEMRRTFNCGLGLVLIVSPDAANKITSALNAAGEASYTIGTLVPRADKADYVQFEG
ncbi:MAG: phosphoribosylformylglycinamidine cyclo-ligase [Holosporales bacterium]